MKYLSAYISCSFLISYQKSFISFTCFFLLDLTSGYSHHDSSPKKLYESSYIQSKQRNTSVGSSKQQDVPPKSDQAKETNSNFMDLNEFLNVDSNENSNDISNQTESESDPDFPKPTVDLLASLLTLGKMIQNQKQMIQNQLKQQTDSTIPSDSLINQELQRETNTQSQSQSFSDHVSESYIEQKETSSPSDDTSPLSKRTVIPEDIKDKDYWNRRKRNNLAAKKSREERRKKELEILETTKHLEKENSQLTSILKRLTSRNEWLESRLNDIRSCRRTDKYTGSSSLSSSTEEN
ncbi:MAG: bZIP transcription factor [Cyanobacteria bacterium J06649_11]